jgi:trimeric autotransporter adhesin
MSSENYRGNFGLSEALDAFLIQFFTFVTSQDDTFEFVDINGDTQTLSTLYSAAGASAQASSVIDISNAADEAVSAAATATGLAEEAAQSANTAQSTATQAQSAAQGASSYAGEAYNAANVAAAAAAIATGAAAAAQTTANTANTNATNAQALAGDAYSEAVNLQGPLNEALNDASQTFFWVGVGGNDAGRWAYEYDTSGAPSVEQDSGKTLGTYALVINSDGSGIGAVYGTTYIPFDPTKLYRIRVRVKQVEATAGSTFNIGVMGFDTNYNPIGADGGATALSIYPFAAENGELAVGSWAHYTGYFQNLVVSGNGTNAATPSSMAPGKLSADVMYFSPAILTNVGASGPSQMLVDYFIIDDVTALIPAQVAAANALTASGLALQADSDALGASGLAENAWVEALSAYALAASAYSAATGNTGNQGSSQSYASTASVYEAQQDASQTFFCVAASSSDTARWSIPEGAGTVAFLSSALATSNAGSFSMGEGILRFGTSQNPTVFVGNDLIPFDPTKIYRIRARIQESFGGNMSIGFAGFDANLNPLDASGGTSYTNMYYVAMQNQTPTINWTEFDGYISGTTTDGTSGVATGYAAPGTFTTGVKFFAPTFYCTSDSFFVDYIIVEDVTALVEAEKAYALASAGAVSYPLNPGAGKTAIQYPDSAWIGDAGGGQIGVSSLETTGAVTAASVVTSGMTLANGSSIVWASGAGINVGPGGGVVAIKGYTSSVSGWMMAVQSNTPTTSGSTTNVAVIDSNGNLSLGNHVTTSNGQTQVSGAVEVLLPFGSILAWSTNGSGGANINVGAGGQVVTLKGGPNETAQYNPVVEMGSATATNFMLDALGNIYLGQALNAPGTAPTATGSTTINLVNGSAIAWSAAGSAMSNTASADASLSVGAGGLSFYANVPATSTQIWAWQLGGTAVATLYASSATSVRLALSGGSTSSASTPATFCLALSGTFGGGILLTDSGNSSDSYGIYTDSGYLCFGHSASGTGAVPTSPTTAGVAINSAHDLYATDFLVNSDITLKDTIEELVYRGPLRPVSFRWIETGVADIGFIAQWILEDYPEVVKRDARYGTYRVSYGRLTAILSAQINRVEYREVERDRRIAELEKQVQALLNKPSWWKRFCQFFKRAQ